MHFSSSCHKLAFSEQQRRACGGAKPGSCDLKMQKTMEVPQMQFIDKVIDVPMQRQAQPIDKVVDVPEV